MTEKKKINSKWIYFGLAMIMLLLMIAYSNIQSFWYDEVYQLGLVRSELSLKEIFQNYYTLGDYTPPLFALLAAVVVRVFPFVNAYYLLVSEIAVAAGVFLLGVTAERMKGRLVGILTTIFSATSYMLIVKAGHEFRAYGLLFFVSVLALYAFVCRYQHLKDNTQKYNILFGLSLVLLVYTHYYGAIVCGAFALFDLFWFIKKEIKLSAIISYIIPGVAFAPWLLLVLFFHESSITSFWVEPPTWRTVVDVLKYFASNNEYLFMIFVGSLIIVVMQLIGKVRRKTYSYESEGLLSLLLWMPVFVMGSMFIYGAVINPGGGIFVHRYFFCIFPCYLIIMSLGVEKLIAWLNEGKRVKGLEVYICLFLFFYFGISNYSAVANEVNYSFEPYQESAKDLSKKGDISNDSTVVVLPDCEYVKEGYRYYFEKKGKVIKVNLLSQHEKDFETKLLQYDKVYFVEGHEDIKKKTKTLLKKNYKRIYPTTKYMISAYLKSDLYDIKYKDKEEDE